MKKHGRRAAGSGEAEGARRATGGSPEPVGPLEPGQRWTFSRKEEVVLRMLRGEPMDKLSRELGVEIYRLEAWRDRALEGMEAGLKKRREDPLQTELDAAMKRIGELTMENELLYERCRKGGGPFPKGRSRR
ncbi:MAG: IS3 family transposase [bacterium]|nr:IS3 family transposase [bacterium]